MKPIIISWKTLMRHILMCLLLIGLTPVAVNAVGPAIITIASWNIQQFGPAKLGDPVRLGRLATVVKEFDVVAIQEITHIGGNGQPVIDGLTGILHSEHDRTYTGILGPRTGCDGGRIEQYAILFDSTILQEVNSRTIADDSNATHNMCRDPLVATLRLIDTSANFTFTLVVVHTDPDPAAAFAEDLNALGRIFREVQTGDTQDDDVILLGDLNAHPHHLQGLGTVPDLVYAIPDQSTMVRGQSRNDNMVFQWGPTGEDFTGTAGIFPVEEFLAISNADANRLSDHLPVYAVFFTRRDSQ